MLNSARTVARRLAVTDNRHPMASPLKKKAARRFRLAIEHSNALHAIYLDDPGLYDAYDRFTRWQFDYMLPFFEDQLEPPGYADAISFVISDLAGVGVSARDHDIERATPVIVRSLPLHALELAASAAELNVGALEFNLAICRALLENGKLPASITEDRYCSACRRASSFDECMELVHLAVDLGRGLKGLVRVPLISVLLRTMKVPAHAAGFGALQEFLETGFVTFRRIKDIDRFLDLLGKRLNDVFVHIHFSELESDNCKSC
jgi:hypothetical protein